MRQLEHLDAKSDEVKNSVFICVCVGRLAGMRSESPAASPVATQAECNMCKMTFALPEEPDSFGELRLCVQRGPEKEHAR